VTRLTPIGGGFTPKAARRTPGRRPIAVTGERVTFDDTTEANVAAGDAYASRIRAVIDDFTSRRVLDAPGPNLSPVRRGRNRKSAVSGRMHCHVRGRSPSQQERSLPCKPQHANPPEQWRPAEHSPSDTVSSSTNRYPLVTRLRDESTMLRGRLLMTRVAAPAPEGRHVLSRSDWRPLLLCLEVVTGAAPETKEPRCSAVSESPLPDSNRRPLPYHGGPAMPRKPLRRPKPLHMRQSGCRNTPRGLARFGTVRYPLGTRRGRRYAPLKGSGGSRSRPLMRAAAPPDREPPCP
jgi:hypothetical protein